MSSARAEDVKVYPAQVADELFQDRCRVSPPDVQPPNHCPWPEFLAQRLKPIKPAGKQSQAPSLPAQLAGKSLADP